MSDNKITCSCKDNVHPARSTRRVENFTDCTCSIADPSRKSKMQIKVKEINILSAAIKNP